MAKIIKQREKVECQRTELNFYLKETGEVCWGFPITNGEVIPLDPNGNPCEKEKCYWWKNYINAKENTSLFSRIETRKWSYTESAVAICECGKEITLDYDAQGCWNCGRLHNLFGQELKPRHMWEEYDDDEFY